MHDIVAGSTSVPEAREYYAKEFADYRRKKPTPSMEQLRFTPPSGTTADPDTRMLSDDDLQRARQEGEGRGLRAPTESWWPSAWQQGTASRRNPCP